MIRIWQWCIFLCFPQNFLVVSAFRPTLRIQAHARLRAALHRSGSHAESASGSNGFEELPHAAEFLVTLFEQRGERESEKIPKRASENRIEQRGGSLMIQVGAALRFGNNFVDDAELTQIAGRDLEGFRCDFCL
jgi:hypothetical protein